MLNVKPAGQRRNKGGAREDREPPAVGFKPIARALKPCSPRRSAMSVMVSEMPTPTIVTVAIAETRAGT